MPRENERVPFLNEVVLEFASGKREARISDLGPGGCYVDSIVPVTKGEPVSLHIRSASESMRFDGDVAYVLDRFGFGVKFKGLTGEHDIFLRQIIDSAGK